MCQLDRGKSENIEEFQEVKHTNKRVKFIDRTNKERTPKLKSEGATKSDDADIPRQVWDERVFLHFPNVQPLT